jgi:hypothetical protein
MASITPDFATLLYEQATLWRVAPEGGQEPLVRLACDALVAGQESAGLVRLAGASTRGRDYDFAAAVAAALADLGRALPDRDASDAQIGATRAMCRKLLDGHITPRDLARWAHIHVGHEGAAELQSLVDLDDAYDTIEYVDVGTTAAGLDQDTVTTARGLLAQPAS